jgi:hypothetical protein
MPANTNPIFPLTPQVVPKTLVTADTSLTTPNTQGQGLLTGGTNGTRVDAIKARALGTNVASVLRIFFNDGLGTAASNFSLVAEIKLPASTAAIADVTGTDILLLPINYDNAGGVNGNAVLPPYLKSGQKLYVSIGTTVATGWAITGFGGDY